LILLQAGGESSRIKKSDSSNFRIFNQLIDKNSKKSQNTSTQNERSVLIKQPNHFPNINPSGK